MRIKIQTLVDITRTDIRRKGQGEEKKVHQQQNFQTLIQTINLRNLIESNNDPYVQTVDVNGLGFGSDYKGEHKVWTYEFVVDHADAYKTTDDNVGLLKEDFTFIPIIGGLEETIPNPKMFVVNDKGKTNISIQVV